ncbi:hypothetical protein GEMRC1_013307 [Eukaryota sp. GEM-RC1]
MYITSQSSNTSGSSFEPFHRHPPLVDQILGHGHGQPNRSNQSSRGRGQSRGRGGYNRGRGGNDRGRGGRPSREFVPPSRGSDGGRHARHQYPAYHGSTYIAPPSVTPQIYQQPVYYHGAPTHYNPGNAPVYSYPP